MATSFSISSSRTDRDNKTDWKLCCLCQKTTTEGLRTSSGGGYLTLATNIPEFYNLNCMPISFDPKRLDEDDGILQTLENNKAKYHESCRLKFNSSKLQRKRRSRTVEDIDEASTSKVTRSSHDTKDASKEVKQCFLCDKESPTDDLRQAMTFNLNEKLKRCAINLLDEKLLAKLSVGDIIAQECMYHLTCLTALYNRERSWLASQGTSCNESQQHREAHAHAFAELETYIRETQVCTDGGCVFRLNDLFELYTKQLGQLNVSASSVHRTRLKGQILARIPDLEAYHKGREVWFAFREKVGCALASACEYNDALVLAKAAKIIRNQILEHKPEFSGSLSAETQTESVPQCLLEFVSLVEHGGDIKSQIEHGSSQTDLNIAQLLLYNCHKTQTSATFTRHSKLREPPFPVYVGLLLFAKTRKRQLIDTMYQNGLSISYDRVLEISKQLGDSVVNRAVAEGIVCPTALRHGLFTTCAVDNLDHNPSSTTVQTSFHGTGISVFQNPSRENTGNARNLPWSATSRNISKKVPSLPEYYANVPPAHFKQGNPFPTALHEIVHDDLVLSKQLTLEYEWLQKVNLSIDIENATSLSWAAHHASEGRGLQFEVSVSSLMPLFQDSAHSVAMIKHSMNIAKATTDFLNPGQIPVVAVDQPLFALAKQIQWQWPALYGEGKMFIMFGGLHIEMAALKMLGDILKDSGWTSALAEAEIATAGTAESFLTASHVAKTRHAHQVTSCSLYQLSKEAYSRYVQDAETAKKQVLCFADWSTKRESESPQFQFWNLVLRLELLVFLFLRSYREGNFQLYKEALRELIPFCFALDHVHYARWLTVHLQDLESHDSSSTLVAEFQRGNFVVHKTQRPFSGIAIDQAHEQNNAYVKGDGGAIGLTEDPSALRRWTVSGPEVSRLIQEFELSDKKALRRNVDTKHHDDNPSTQNKFLASVKCLRNVIDQMGNPFEEESSELIVLGSHEIFDDTVSESLRCLESLGKKQFEEFVARPPSRFYEPIRKNKLCLLSRKPCSASKHKQSLQTLKDDCSLFSRLFISCQGRQCDLEDFFQHENQSSPPALARNGMMHQGSKSQLLPILESHSSEMIENEPDADAIIIDGAAFINALRPSTGTTFQAYARDEILPRIEKYAHKYKQTHIVFDTYQEGSLKSQTRQKRGTGARRRVVDATKTPSNWASFLRVDQNKTELFGFLAIKIASLELDNLIVVTKGNSALCNHAPAVVSDLQGCSQEEADTRMFLHAAYAASHGITQAIVVSSDTDVVVIAVSLIHSIGLQKLWIAFGKGKDSRWIPIHEIASAMGPKAFALPFFHAFSGCDTVSSFHGKGKKSAWQTWSIFDKVDATFVKLSSQPERLSDEDLQILEEFVVLLYDRSSSCSNVNEARLDLFARKQRAYDSIPPTSAALKQHVKRAALQAGHIWSQSLVCNPVLPSPGDWGWRHIDGTWAPYWTDLTAVAKSCQELTHCGCKMQCSGRCKCFKAGLSCTALCSCTC